MGCGDWGYMHFPVTIRYARNLLDPKLYPAQELEKLCFRRWNVELHFRQIKTMLAWMSCAALPPGWYRSPYREHINTQGRHSFVMPEAVVKGELRPLRNPADDPD